MEESSWPENLPSCRKRAIKELIQGREFANQLLAIMADGSDGTKLSVSAADGLVEKIVGSFTHTLSILNSLEPDGVLEIPPRNGDSRKSEDSGVSSKTPAARNRRGTYKRRKTSQASTSLTTSLMDDGHAWRKYGQKMILNSKYPRNYYRCTHKLDQDCQATKQVQRTQEDPPMYTTMYYGQHTCCRFLKSPEIILDSTPTPDSSLLLSFESNSLPDHPINSVPSTIKSDYNVAYSGFDSQHSSSDYLQSTLRSSGPLPIWPSASLDYGDAVTSGVGDAASSRDRYENDSGLGMETIGGCLEFDEFGQFEFCYSQTPAPL